MNVLINLHKGYGLGDGVAMSAVLKHVVAYRPDWTIDFQAEEGRHQVGRGIVTNTFAWGTPYPHSSYDAEALICLYEKWHGWTDRPNTRVSACLHETFGLGWNPDHGRYQVAVSQETSETALVAMGVGCRQQYKQSKSHRTVNRYEGKIVALHYQGDTAKANKDLTHAQAAAICNEIEKLGRMPLLIDWRNESPVPDRHNIRTVGRTPAAMRWGASAEMNCAIIRHCEAFVGIDSGPAKCASATETPSLIVWACHHPAQFHDPAPNTVHLIPKGCHNRTPVNGNHDVIDWFNHHYTTRFYNDNLVYQVEEWLKDTLK